MGNSFSIERTWKDRLWLAIDTETTGIDVTTARIVELTAVSFVHGEPAVRFAELVNPRCPIPAEAQAVHGISDEGVACAPWLVDVAADFLEQVRAAPVLVGYNWPFDAAILEREFGEAWREAIAGKPILDPLVVVRFDGVGRYWKGAGRHRLSAVAERLGIRVPGSAHRAAADAIMAGLVLWSLRDALPDDGLEAAARIERERARQQADFEAYRARLSAAAPDKSASAARVPTLSDAADGGMHGSAAGPARQGDG